MINVTKHGIKYNRKNSARCLCGCEFDFEDVDIIRDSSISLTNNPGQIRNYILCPECDSKIFLGTEFIY